MAAEKAWGIGMKRACVSRQGGGGAEGEVLAWRLKAQSTTEASKKEACFHVESQRIAEGTIPYQPISWRRELVQEVHPKIFNFSL
jgi:hypothetical protein